MKRLFMFAIIGLLVSCKGDKEEKGASVTASTPAVYSIENTKSSITITNNGIMADIKPYLPKLDIGEYRFARFYNISNKNYYGILCVLDVDGIRDVNLNTFPVEYRDYRKVGTDFNIAGDGIIRPYGQRKLDGIQANDKITVICFHDDEFDETNTDNAVLKHYSARLPNFDTYKHHDYTDIGIEPKRGSGGILTVTAE